MTSYEPGNKKVKHEVGMRSTFKWDPYVAQYSNGLVHRWSYGNQYRSALGHPWSYENQYPSVLGHQWWYDNQYHAYKKQRC